MAEHQEEHSDSSTDDDCTPVTLGFVEKSPAWLLRSEFFRSKVGGKPAWLHLSGVPTCDLVSCGKCKGPCIFLCQVYAPLTSPDAPEDCFHRTIFLFMCPSAECCQPNDSSNFKVLRSQLKRLNKFYSNVPPVDNEEWVPAISAETFNKLCKVCGLKGTAHCGKCRQINYCSRQHQVADWKAGHKALCGFDDNITSNARPSPLLLPEWELIQELEPKPKLQNQKSNEERLQEFQRLEENGLTGTLQGNSEAESELAAMPESQEDVAFKKFKEVTCIAPDQVLRYEREGEPLWVSDQNQPNELPECPMCKSPRVFEFQVLPQMLNHLNLDKVGQSIDWGTLAVFTCKQSCGSEPPYKEEVVIKQDFSHISL